MAESIKGTDFEAIFDYHADTVEIGRLAQDYGVPHMVLTHLIPAPNNEKDESRFEADLRTGGYTGKVTVGRDLMSFDLG
jgi:ribonuclease Z